MLHLFGYICQKEYVITNVSTSSRKYPLFFSDFNQKNFLDRISKNLQISNFIKFRAMGTDLFHAEGQTRRSQ